MAFFEGINCFHMLFIDLKKNDFKLYFNSLLYISHLLGIHELNEICIYLGLRGIRAYHAKVFGGFKNLRMLFFGLYAV